MPSEYTKHIVFVRDSRNMKEVQDSTVDLVVTSPPYPMISMWDDMFRRAGAETYDEMHEYLDSTWKEVFRVLRQGGIMCVNIGDALRTKNGTFRLYANHARVLDACEKLGFIPLPYILWKKPTNRPNAFLGSGFLPPNAYITLDCEYILIFRKGGLRRFGKGDKDRYESAFSKEERDVWFSQIWEMKGARQRDSHDKRRTAEFPEEIAERLIRMFSVIGDTVLDPFLGTGTTSLVAMKLKRNSIGYEIDGSLFPLIRRKLMNSKGSKGNTLEFVE